MQFQNSRKYSKIQFQNKFAACLQFETVCDLAFIQGKITKIMKILYKFLKIC